MDNQEIAKVFDEIADMLEITGENFFRVRAYRNAARTVNEHPVRLCDLGPEELDQIPGIGKELTAKIITLCKGGEVDLHRKLLSQVPRGLLELRHIHGLGPKRIKLLVDRLDIKDRDSLKRAAEAGALRSITGLGAKLEEQILKAMAEGAAAPDHRMLYCDAARIVANLLDHMSGCRGIANIEPAGSFRRRRDTVGDLDILVAADNAAPVMDRLLSYAQVKQTLGTGETKTTVVLSENLQVDLRVVAPGSFGAALVYFTGSKAHGIHLRKIAQARGLLLNEYGLHRGKRSLAGADEKGVYRALGLEWIPPELREDRGEIEAAAENRLPKLIQRDDLRGDLHSHSTWTDGRNSIEEMVRSAKKAGLEYLAVTDHSQRLKMAHGLDPVRLREQWREIDKVADHVGGIRVLKGIEVDILDDGSLDLPDDVVGKLDWVVASVHSKLDMDEKAMTRRMVKAIRNPNVSVIGHPSNRLIGRRTPSHFDLDQVLAAAREEGCALEINSQPDRLDLTDVACLAAKRAGIKLVISSDSHSIAQFADLEYGVNQARRGWIESADVLNTLSAAKLLARH